MLKIKRIFFFSAIFLLTFFLVYTRFTNLSWGIPYPMHPDEHNMATAIASLSCDVGKTIKGIGKTGSFSLLKDCFNPHFFAYGQLSLYLGYFLVFLSHFFTNSTGQVINPLEGIIALRLLSTFMSIANVVLLLKIFKLLIRERIRKKERNIFAPSIIIALLIYIFSPGMIQLAHFGTTEATLTFLYSLIVYHSLLFIENENGQNKFIFYTAFLIGIASAVKISSFSFLFLIPFVFLFKQRKNGSYGKFFLKQLLSFFKIFIFSLPIFFIFSPHNWINFNYFSSALNYETNVALGKNLVFYTQQFFQTKPIVFQMAKIFPYILGFPAFFIFLISFFLLPSERKINFLRIAFLVYFLPVSFSFAKWTRFMAPIFPIILLFISLFLHQIFSFFIRKKNRLNHTVGLIFSFSLLLVTILPGVAYLSIYRNEDVRFKASRWVFRNIPANSFILSETANVINLPLAVNNLNIKPKNYQLISFDFYHLDRNSLLQKELTNNVEKADYIFVPSRRIFANYSCFSPWGRINKKKCNFLEKKYPILNRYYQNLFSEKLGFKKVAQFESYPEINLFGKKIDFPDEQAEETWTVFDHPVIRIYRRIKKG